MQHTERLLERLVNYECKRTPKGSGRERLLRSISLYLSALLNTHRGAALSVPDMGVPDLNSVRFGGNEESFGQMARDIEACILKYEPRVKDATVDFLPDKTSPLSLVFKIGIVVQYNQEDIPAVFETILESDGRIAVGESSNDK